MRYFFESWDFWMQQICALLLYGRRQQLNCHHGLQRIIVWQSQHGVQRIIENYTLLVELSNGDARILSEVFQLEAGPNGDCVFVAMAEGLVQFPFRHDGNLNISLTVTRRSDTKYMSLCKEAAVLGATEDYISFENPDLPPLLKYFLPRGEPSHYYFIFLDDVHWHETESGYMVTSFETINIEVLDQEGAIPIIAMLEMWDKLGDWI